MPTTPAAPIIGKGLQFEYSTDGTTYLPVNGVTEVDFGSSKVDINDITTVQNPDNVRRFQGGLENPGDCTIKMQFLPGDTSQAALLAQKDGGVHNYKVIYPAAICTESFAGIIVSWDKNVPLDKPADVTVKFQISGPKAIA